MNASVNSDVNIRGNHRMRRCETVISFRVERKKVILKKIICSDRIRENKTY